MFAGSAHGSVYSTNFDSFNLGEINGQDGWTTDSATPSAGAVIGIGGLVWGSRSASLGYVAPLDMDNVYLSHEASTPLVGGAGGTNASFSVLFQVMDSDSGFGGGSEARDTFGFRLQNSSGYNLFSFILTPWDQSSTPETDTEFNKYSWTTGSSAPTPVLVPPLYVPIRTAEEFFAYNFKIDFALSGSNDVSFVGDINGDEFYGTLPDLGGESIDRFGAFWNTLNGKDAPGSNFLILEGVSLVPEPSSLLLGLLGTSFALARRRRP